MSPETFVVWAMSDAHVGTDLNRGRESLSDAILQAEGRGGSPGFHWDVALNLGDFSGSQTPPGDEEGREVVRQYGAAILHPRGHFYDLVGNHDASGADESTQWWFRKWLDPTGESPAHSGVLPDGRPFPVEGTWERYCFRAGNLVFLMMGDRNDGGPPVGRGSRGGYPAGAVTRETFDWWVEQVESVRDGVVISAHHHMLKGTTVASGDWEGVDNGYHGRFEDGAPIGASYLYWIGGEPDSGRFEAYLDGHSGASAMWLGAHTHARPDDREGGRSHVETRWGTHFVNVGALTRYHGEQHSMPMSRVLTFTEGSDAVTVRCYLHTNEYAPQGWYPPAERVLRLPRSFHAP